MVCIFFSNLTSDGVPAALCLAHLRHEQVQNAGPDWDTDTANEQGGDEGRAVDIYAKVFLVQVSPDLGKVLPDWKETA